MVAIVQGLEMGSSDDGYDDPFAGIYEPFSGLNEMDFELHGIYMDHEPRQEFVSRLDKCKDHFLNILLCDANIRNASMTDEVKDQVDHDNDLQNDEAEEEVTNKYRIHDPNFRWDKMEPKLGDVFESPVQLKFCETNYAVNGGYQRYFQKSDNRRIVARSGKRHEDNKFTFRLYAAWMYNDRTFQVKAMNYEHLCSGVFKFGSIVTPERIGRHYVTEIANEPKIKLREMISNIKQRYRCVVSIGQVRRAKQWAKELIEGK
ncbi:unnamed protein product [Lactuca saligna]|uniref:Transposase MuDR plant domain-containing protein n=1 Tax=Lactuca saligna TaxID=75948 RepID=A0AA35ZV45_LACSI|nr:unnamed protein product [Lactuca saligna]